MGLRGPGAARTVGQVRGDASEKVRHRQHRHGSLPGTNRRTPTTGRQHRPSAPPTGHQPPGATTATATPRTDDRKHHEPPRGAAREKNRRRPTLPGPCEPSTIGAERLNCSVRNGKRCFPLAKATGKRRETSLPGPSKLHSATQVPPLIKKIRQALEPLVPVSYGRHRPSRSGLSTWWSTRGLTPSRGWESSSRGRLPA
jgi:hypothetical protein